MKITTTGVLFRNADSPSTTTRIRMTDAPAVRRGCTTHCATLSRAPVRIRPSPTTSRASTVSKAGLENPETRSPAVSSLWPPSSISGKTSNSTSRTASVPRAVISSDSHSETNSATTTAVNASVTHM